VLLSSSANHARPRRRRTAVVVFLQEGITKQKMKGFNVGGSEHSRSVRKADQRYLEK
jgi:hypothetical protein